MRPNSIEQSPSREVNSHSKSQESPSTYGFWGFTAVYTGPYPGPDKSSPQPLILIPPDQYKYYCFIYA